MELELDLSNQAAGWAGQPKRLAEKSYKICQYQLVSSQLWSQYSDFQHQKHSINNYSSEYFQTNWQHLQVKLGQPDLPEGKWQESSLTFSDTKLRNQGQFKDSSKDPDL